MPGTVLRALYEFSGCRSEDGPSEATKSFLLLSGGLHYIVSFEKDRRTCVFLPC